MNSDTREPALPGKDKLLSILVSVVTGSVAGIFFHYVLYLMSLPQKPFIYAWF